MTPCYARMYHKKGVSKTISVSPNGPLLMAVMTPSEAC